MTGQAAGEHVHTVRNSTIAALFERFADLLEIDESNPFRVRAYRNAARLIASLPREVSQMLAEGEDLDQLPGIGEDLAEKIAHLARTGRFPALERLQRRIPATLTSLLAVPTLGPKRVHTLYRELGITTLDELCQALRRDEVGKLPGFGKRTVERIAEGLEHMAQSQHRHPLPQADAAARELLTYLEQTQGLQALTVAGSVRRRRETVGDLDMLASGDEKVLMQRFLAYPEIAQVLSQGAVRATVVLRTGLQVDLRVVPIGSYGAALLYFTGSKAHTVALRTLAVRRGMKINEYGIYRGDKRIAGRREEDVYEQLGLSPIPPELRENRGELEAAAQSRLPNLVTLADIQGDLHAHTDATDGRDSLEEMAARAADKGYAYLAITDHSKRLRVARGQNEKQLRQQMTAIDTLNARLRGLAILKSAEVDILADGTLDLPDSLLAELDLVVCAVHSHFRLTRERQTERLIRAMDNRYCHILAHPTGRLLGQRSPYAVDMERVACAAAQRGVWLEVNAQPARLDLNDMYCRLAHEVGARVVISSDAHSTDQLDHMRYGVDQARRGWLTADDVVNTRTLSELRKLRRRH